MAAAELTAVGLRAALAPYVPGLGTVMLTGFLLSGVIQGYNNSKDFNKSCKNIDDANKTLNDTLGQWKQIFADQSVLQDRLKDFRQELLTSTNAVQVATEHAVVEYKRQIKQSEITLAVLIFIIVVLLTVKRFRIIEKIIEIFK